jgi:flagellar FliL protein
MADPEIPVEETQAPAKKGKLKTIILLAAGLAILGGGGFVGVRYWRGRAAAKPDLKKEEPLTEKVKSMVNLDPFLVNLADQDAARFVKVTFKLGLDQAGLTEEYGSDSVAIAAARDRIVSLLSSKTSEELLSEEGKEELRAQIKEKLTPLLPKGKIVEVFIMEFVVQL